LEKRRGGLRALASEVPRIAAPVLGKRGFAAAQLVSEWASVVGAELAAKISPDRLSFPRSERRDGTLRVRVAAGLAVEIQHRAPLILDRINGFFGYGAVSRLVLVQGPPARPPCPAPARPRPLSADERAVLDRRLDRIRDPALRDALRRLGEAVIGTAKG
jgi:hypothetical protein